MLDLREKQTKQASGAGATTITFGPLANERWWINPFTLDGTISKTALVKLYRSGRFLGFAQGIPAQGGPIRVESGEAIDIVITGAAANDQLTANMEGFRLTTDEEFPFDSTSPSALGSGTFFSGLHADLSDTDTAGHIGALLSTGPAGTTHWEIVSAFFDFIRGFFAGDNAPSLIQKVQAGLQLYSGKLLGTDAQSSVQLYGGAASQIRLNAVGGALAEIQIITGEIRLITGSQARGYCSAQAKAVAANDIFGHGVMYGGITTLANTPSSITLTPVGSDVNIAASGVTAGVLNVRGFHYSIKANAAGNMIAVRTYVTVGN